ncbi:MAG: riboflavin synthase [Victivallaceae bacterium]
MFTGLVEAKGIFKRRQMSGNSGKLLIQVPPAMQLEHGESVAVNGACLTYEGNTDGVARFHTLAETLRHTNLGKLQPEATVNLERAMRADGRFGGHIVSGHVDCTSKVLGLTRGLDDYELKVATPAELRPYLVKKGSICIDGISLTLVEVNDDFFTVCLIPITLSETALKERQIGSLVNLESDMLGKYVFSQLQYLTGGGEAADKKPITMDFLRQAGF